MFNDECSQVQTGGHSSSNMNKEEKPNNKKEEDYSIIINEEIRKKINKKEKTLKERVEWFHSQMDRDANQAESWLMGLEDITSEEENFKDRYTYWIFGGTL